MPFHPQFSDHQHQSPWQIDLPGRRVFYEPLDLTFSMVFDPERFSVDVIGVRDIRAVPLPSRNVWALPAAEVHRIGRLARERYVEMLWIALQNQRCLT